MNFHVCDVIVVFAVNANATVQHSCPSHKINCNKDPADDGNGSRQRVDEKPGDTWTVVGKDTKRDCRTATTRHTAAESEVTSQSKSRKKRNRRNRDRTASATTLDFRSTSCSAVHEGNNDCPKNPISERKSFHTSDKVTCNEKPTTGICKLSHTKSDHLPDTFSCQSSAGDSGRDTAVRQVAKDGPKPASVASFCSGNT